MSFSLQCFFFAKKLDTSLFFDKKGFPAAFQNATPVNIFVAISVQALSLITKNLSLGFYLQNTCATGLRLTFIDNRTLPDQSAKYLGQTDIEVHHGPIKGRNEIGCNWEN